MYSQLRTSRQHASLLLRCLIAVELRASLNQRHIAGAEILGGALMLLFFVTIGAAAGSPRSLLGCGWLAMFMIVQLAVHLGIVLGVGKAAGLPMQVSHTPNCSL